MTLAPMRIHIESFIAQLISTEIYDDAEGVWTFDHQSECGVCTNAATRVAETFSGIVWGYRAMENPTALIGEPHCSGHDFAMIQHRWLVDYWAFRVARLSPKAVLDLNRAPERRLARSLYGTAVHWKQVAAFDGRMFSPRILTRDGRPETRHSV